MLFFCGREWYNLVFIKKKEIYKRAHLSTKIPEECLSHDDKKQEQNGFFTSIKGYFKYSPTSKVCLDYAEAVMIDSVYQISIIEVIIWSVCSSYFTF